MRMIGGLKDERQVRVFRGFLKSKSIESEARASDDPAAETKFTIWALNEDQLAEAKAHFTQFQQNPDQEEFKKHELPALVKPLSSMLPDEESRENAKRLARSNRARLRRIRQGSGQVHLGLIALCVAIYFLNSVEGLSYLTRYLYFSEDPLKLIPFAEIRSGQIWRLFTPILMHGSFLHITFNMIWIYQLGGMIERNESSLYFILLLLGTAAVSNLAEYLWTGPNFIGISGVVYAFLGYIYVMSRYSHKPYFIDNFTMAIMIIWLVLCILGVIGRIANATHLAGLASGTIWGLIHSGAFRK